LKEAEKKMQAVQKSLDEVIEAIAKLEAEKEKLAALKIELEKALAELKREEEEYKNKCNALQVLVDVEHSCQPQHHR
jgi:chromosome segregation ATPase